MSQSEFNSMLAVWIGIAVVTFFVLLRVTAPYGRHTSSRWGPQISNKLGWVLMEAPVLITLYVIVLSAPGSISYVTWLIIGLFTVHYLNRICVYPLRIRTRGKKMPLMIAASGVLFNLINGFFLGYYFGYFAEYDSDWLAGIPFVAGTLLFITGMYLNWRADNILIHLRKQGETGYVIPRGWLFEYVSCPNLFGEMIEWLGFAILCWNVPALAFAIWTAANLIPRAISHHKWYQSEFNNYPKQRDAIIPFVV